MKIKRRTDYFLVPQEALCDRRLSLEQLGFLCTLYDLQGEKNDEWSLAGQCRITVGDVVEMLKSLTDLGYLSRCDGGYVLYNSLISTPIFNEVEIREIYCCKANIFRCLAAR